MAEPVWLTIGRELQALSQTGRTFTQDPFDRKRYERIRELAASLLAEGFDTQPKVLLDLFQTQSGYATPKVDMRGAAFERLCLHAYSVALAHPRTRKPLHVSTPVPEAFTRLVPRLTSPFA